MTIDFGNIDDPFYKTHFTLPNDIIHVRFREVIGKEHYQTIMPSSILKGLPMMKQKHAANMKRIPLYSKVIAEEYQELPKSDYAIIKDNVAFFVNNLPSFKKQKDNDKLDWIIKQYRLLACEIFEYYKSYTTIRKSTIEYRFKCILIIMNIAFRAQTSPLYQLTSAIISQIHNHVVNYTGNKYDKTKYIEWEKVLEIQKDMEAKFKRMKKDTRESYDFNNDLLLISMYCLIPPLRNEIKLLEFTESQQDNDKDYVFINKKKNIVWLKLNLKKNVHNPITFDLVSRKYKSPHLASIIRESYKLYPRKYLFTKKNNFPYMDKKTSKRALDERMVNIFYRNGINQQITINSLRSSYVKYMYQQNLTQSDKLDMQIQMRTTIECLERSYQKILTNSATNDGLDETDSVIDYDEGMDVYDDDVANGSSSQYLSASSNESSSIDISHQGNSSSSNSRNSSSSNKSSSNKSSSKQSSSSNNSPSKNSSSIHSSSSNKSLSNKSSSQNISLQSIETIQSSQSIPSNASNASIPSNALHSSEYSSLSIPSNASKDDCKEIKIPKALTQYQRKQEKKKEYYKKNRQQILQKAKEYADRMTPFEKSRIRALTLLNNSPDYQYKIKKSTLDKYQFFFDESEEKWKYHEDEES